MAEYERKIGQQAMEIDFFKGCLGQIEELRKSQANSKSALCRKIQQERESGAAMTTARMTSLAGLSRPTYFNPLVTEGMALTSR